MFGKMSAKLMKESMDKLVESGMVPDPEEMMKKIANSFGPSAVVNPGEILEMGAVRPFEGRPAIVTDTNNDQCQIQQNGIDLRLDEVQYIQGGRTSFTLNKENDERCRYTGYCPDENNMFTFYPNQQYALDFMEWVEVPEDMSAYIFVRSSINRYSGVLMTGYWDSGFSGRLGSILRPFVETRIQKGVRVAQIVFFRSDPARLYDGQYKGQTKQA